MVLYLPASLVKFVAWRVSGSDDSDGSSSSRSVRPERDGETLTGIIFRWLPGVAGVGADADPRVAAVAAAGVAASGSLAAVAAAAGPRRSLGAASSDGSADLTIAQ